MSSSICDFFLCWEASKLCCVSYFEIINCKAQSPHCIIKHSQLLLPSNWIFYVSTLPSISFYSPISPEHLVTIFLLSTCRRSLLRLHRWVPHLSFYHWINQFNKNMSFVLSHVTVSIKPSSFIHIYGQIICKYGLLVMDT